MIASMWLVSLVVTAVVLFYFYRKSKHQFFKARGIPGPEPHWFWGSLRNFTDDQPPIVWMRKCNAKYGSIWGYFEGPEPNLVISDPDAIQEVFIKQFSSFHGRKLFILHEDPDCDTNVSMFNARGERWKRLRTIVNPAFSDLKLRSMFPLMKNSMDAFMEQLEDIPAGQSFDIFRLFKRLTLDIIGECAFGISLDTLRTKDDALIESVDHIFALLAYRSFLIRLAEALPWLQSPVRKVLALLKRLLVPRGGIFLVQSRVRQVIAQRRADPSSGRTDILQLLLDAQVGTTKRKALSAEEAVCQTQLFLFAGIETSSTALAFLAYAMARHPDIQERLQNEIDEVYATAGEDENSRSEHLSNMEYMNMVINEALRFYPISASVVNRKCMTDATVLDYHIPKGTNVIADVWAANFDPKIWGPIDPQIFDPERFAPGERRHPAACLAFGAGPRYCVGQRFAMMEIRATLFRLLRRFSVRSCAETQVPLRVKFDPTNTPESSVDVVLEPRQFCAVRPAAMGSQD